MMRIAAILATEAGIEVCGPIHDAFLIVSPLDRLHRDVQEMQEIMTEAGRLVTGIPVLTDAKIIRFPDRYMDERGARMWDAVMKLLAQVESGQRQMVQPYVHEIALH
jgi:DNA polymerase-1